MFYVVYNFILCFVQYEKDDSIHSLGIQLMELALNTSGCSDNSCCINKRPRCILDIDAFFLLVSLTYVSEVMVHPAEEKEIVRGGSDIICLKVNVLYISLQL